jgi:predicted ATPase
MIIEDLHWIDGASEELLKKITASEAKAAAFSADHAPPVLLPPWLDRLGRN